MLKYEAESKFWGELCYRIANYLTDIEEQTGKVFSQYEIWHWIDKQASKYENLWEGVSCEYNHINRKLSRLYEDREKKEKESKESPWNKYDAKYGILLGKIDYYEKELNRLKV